MDFFGSDFVHALVARTAFVYAVVYWRKLRRSLGFAVTDLDVRVTDFGRRVQSIEQGMEATKHPPQP